MTTTTFVDVCCVRTLAAESRAYPKAVLIVPATGREPHIAAPLTDGGTVEIRMSGEYRHYNEYAYFDADGTLVGLA